MKILHVVNLRRFGGIQTLVRMLTACQADRPGDTVAVLNIYRDGVADGFAPGVSIVHGDLTSDYDVHISKYLRMYRLFRRSDVLHFHEFQPFLALAAVLSSRTILHTEHGTFQQANQRLSLKKFFLKRVLGYSFLNHFADVVVFVSRWLRDDVRLVTPAVRVIHNAAPAAALPRPQDGSAPDRFRVLTAARLVPRKRIDRLIDSVALLEDAPDVLLQIVGEGPLMASLRTHARARLPRSGYAFYGFRDDVDAFYDRADLVVLPTHAEPFGLIVVEAMAHGKVVLCFADGGGGAEILTGLHPHLIADTVADMARLIAYWRRHPGERRQVGARLREVARSRYTVDRMAAAYRAAYAGPTAATPPATLC